MKASGPFCPVHHSGVAMPRYRNVCLICRRRLPVCHWIEVQGDALPLVDLLCGMKTEDDFLRDLNFVAKIVNRRHRRALEEKTGRKDEDAVSPFIAHYHRRERRKGNNWPKKLLWRNVSEGFCSDRCKEIAEWVYEGKIVKEAKRAGIPRSLPRKARKGDEWDYPALAAAYLNFRANLEKRLLQNRDT